MNTIQNEINASTKEIEKFLKKKNKAKLIIVANDKALCSLTTTYAKALIENANKLFIVSNSEYRELNKEILEGAKIVMPNYIDMSVINNASK